MTYNWRARRRTIYDVFSSYGYNISVRYEHYCDCSPSYYVTVYGFSDMDSDDQDSVCYAFDELEEQDFDVQYCDRVGDTFELIEMGPH